MTFRKANFIYMLFFFNQIEYFFLKPFNLLYAILFLDINFALRDVKTNNFPVKQCFKDQQVIYECLLKYYR